MQPAFFPHPELSSPDGMVAIGGQLSVEMLLDAYRHGIFPWPAEDFPELIWWSPDPRAVLPLDGFRASRRLQRRLRARQLRLSSDRCFRRVMEACATGPGRRGGTWITAEMVSAYCQLHQLGHAHSVEVWQQDQLVGGVYGVAIGGVFAAESMFYRVRDASKVALYHLVEHLGRRGYQLLDVQQWTPHTARLGVIEIPRREYLDRLEQAIDLPVAFGTLDAQ